MLLIVAIVAVCFLLANVDYLTEFVNALRTGALIPLVASIVIMIGRYLVQAASYNAAFDAVNHKTGFGHNILLIFSLVFINTFCLFSGATGVAFIIDDAHRKGCDAGQSTGGAILSQIGYFAAIFVISIIGFLTMLISGHMNVFFVVGGLLLALVLVALSSLFFIGHFRRRWLYSLFLFIERLVNRVIGRFNRSLKAGWGRRMGHSFVQTADVLASSPRGTFITILYASLSAILNMACLVAIGYAFGFENVAALVAAFALASISVILSPTPQGIGVVEAVITAILTAYGCSVATAAAIALVYRGIMFWIPFCIGAGMLSQSGFFAARKAKDSEERELRRRKDTGWIAGTLVCIVGLVNIGLAIFPDSFEAFTVLTSWIDMSSLFFGVPLIISSVLLIVCAIGLIMRLRMAWAVTMCLFIIIGGAELLFQSTVAVGVVCILLAIWLFSRRFAFDRPLNRDTFKRKPKPKKDEEKSESGVLEHTSQQTVEGAVQTHAEIPEGSRGSVSAANSLDPSPVGVSSKSMPSTTGGIKSPASPAAPAGVSKSASPVANGTGSVASTVVRAVNSVTPAAPGISASSGKTVTASASSPASTSAGARAHEKK